MASASRFPQLRSLVWAAWALTAALTILLFGRLPSTRVERSAGGAVPTPAEWPATPRLADLDWSRVTAAASPGGPGPSSPAGSLAGRFRLAGTFLEYGDEAVPARRKAVLDDTRTGVQSILGEGEAIDDIRVLRVFIDRVTLRAGGRDEDLWMTFARMGSGGSGAATNTAAAAAGDAGAANADRFGGRRVGENRWLFERSALMAYYRELMDEPERLVKVFDSLRPLYDDARKITGYELHIEGEPDFFDAVGFREGDVVRKVNSMDMTNRRRAEFFIKQFVEGRATAFVIDVERGGQAQKLIYQTR